MTTVIDVFPPDGPRVRHANRTTQGVLVVHERNDGGLVVVEVTEISAVISQGGVTSRPAKRTEAEVASYPPGTTYERVIG